MKNKLIIMTFAIQSGSKEEMDMEKNNRLTVNYGIKSVFCIIRKILTRNDEQNKFLRLNIIIYKHFMTVVILNVVMSLYVGR